MYVYSVPSPPFSSPDAGLVPLPLPTPVQVCVETCPDANEIGVRDNPVCVEGVDTSRFVNITAGVDLLNPLSVAGAGERVQVSLFNVYCSQTLVYMYSSSLIIDPANYICGLMCMYM